VCCDHGSVKYKKDIFQVYCDSSVGIATSYRLDDRGVRVSSPDRVKNFVYVIQTGSGFHPTYPMGTGGCFPGGKAAGA
jgi:hypothetical protein